MSVYFDKLSRAMTLLADDPRTIFMGQAVAYPGTAMFKTLGGVPKHKLLELPVAEDMQMGMAIGMSLSGHIPICIYPRVNFLLLAINQLVLHLDKLPVYSKGGYRPSVIIRTAIASADPLDPGPQHLGNFTRALHDMLGIVGVLELTHANEIVPAYLGAIEDHPRSTILIERMELY